MSSRRAGSRVACIADFFVSIGICNVYCVLPYVTVDGRVPVSSAFVTTVAFRSSKLTFAMVSPPTGTQSAVQEATMQTPCHRRQTERTAETQRVQRAAEKEEGRGFVSLRLLSYLSAILY